MLNTEALEATKCTGEETSPTCAAHFHSFVDFTAIIWAPRLYKVYFSWHWGGRNEQSIQSSCLHRTSSVEDRQQPSEKNE